MSNLTSFDRNLKGRDFIVGDVHGCFDHLQTLLDQANFNGWNDRLFCVGDLIDKGLNSLPAIDFNGHSVRGNHEKMAIDYYNGNYNEELFVMNGGGWFVILDRTKQKEYVDFFNELPYAIEIDSKLGKVGIIHAETDLSWDVLKHQLKGDMDHEDNRKLVARLLSGRSKYSKDDASEVEGIDHLFVGHTPLLQPLTLGNVHYIDTGAFKGTALTMVELGDKIIYHSVPTSALKEDAYVSSFI